MKLEEYTRIPLQGEIGRLDKILADIFDEESRATLQKVISQGLVAIEGKPVKANYRTRGDEVVEITPPEVETWELRPQAMALDIVYEDADVLVINKPRGLVVHPGKSHPDGTLMNGLIHYLGEALAFHYQDKIRPGLVHRIDKDTSGLLVVAKNNHTHQALSKQLADHHLGRTYSALVMGHFTVAEGTIDAPLKRDPQNRLRYCVQAGGKRAVTHFKVLEQYQDASLLSCQLETGRTHQIRVHLEFIAHPLVGDPTYRQGMTHFTSPLKNLIDGQYLHASQLTFTHPTRGKTMTFDCPLPAYFADLLAELEGSPKQS